MVVKHLWLYVTVWINELGAAHDGFLLPGLTKFGLALDEIWGSV